MGRLLIVIALAAGSCVPPPRWRTPVSPGARRAGDVRVAGLRLRGGADAGRRLPSRWTRARLADLQGDLMLWMPGLGLPPGMRATADNGAVPHGVQAGWVWTLDTPRYAAAGRERIYEAARAAGYTHVAIQVARCVPGGGYHGLYPTTAEDCARQGDRVNAVLHELVGHGLIPICAGVAPDAPPAGGLDRSSCPVVMNDWDDSDRLDCRIDALAGAFPDALIYVELPDGARTPEPDACSPSPWPSDGARWLRAARRRAPNFTGVLYEISRPHGLDHNARQLAAAHRWWRGAQEVLFETDTYWKYWDHVDPAAARRDNDALAARAPWLRGCMSGCTPRAPAADRDR